MGPEFAADICDEHDMLKGFKFDFPKLCKSAWKVRARPEAIPSTLDTVDVDLFMELEHAWVVLHSWVVPLGEFDSGMASFCDFNLRGRLSFLPFGLPKVFRAGRSAAVHNSNVASSHDRPPHISLIAFGLTLYLVARNVLAE